MAHRLKGAGRFPHAFRASLARPRPGVCLDGYAEARRASCLERLRDRQELAECLSIGPANSQAAEKNVECAAIRLKPSQTRVEGMGRPDPRYGPDTHVQIIRFFPTIRYPSAAARGRRADLAAPRGAPRTAPSGGTRAAPRGGSRGGAGLPGGDVGRGDGPRARDRGGTWLPACSAQSKAKHWRAQPGATTPRSERCGGSLRNASRRSSSHRSSSTTWHGRGACAGTRTGMRVNGHAPRRLRPARGVG